MNKSTKPKLAKVESIEELFTLARTDDGYAQLAACTAFNLGANLPGISGGWKTDAVLRARILDKARQRLDTDAGGGSERGVVAEINFCRNLV